MNGDAQITSEKHRRRSRSTRRSRVPTTDDASQISGLEEDARSPSVADISLPPAEEELTVPTRAYAPFSPEVIVLLMPGSVLGALARLGIEALVTYDGQAIFPLAWVQAAGCFIMGFALSLKREIGDFYSPLYTGITTGFCGSVTTFSSWQFDVFTAWDNVEHFRRSWLRTAIDGISRILFTIAISLSAVGFGMHFGRNCRRFLPSLKPASLYLRATFVFLSISIYVLTIPFYVRLSPSFRTKATAALMFSFPGTFLRYFLSWLLNPRLKLFPAGTFTANSLGTAILAMCHVLQATSSGNRSVPCGILQGLIDGLCGCLTTVSTFAVEVRELKGYRAWTYVIVSVVTGQLLCLVILGPSWWSAGLNADAKCPIE